MTQYDFRWVKSTPASPFRGPSDLDISIYSDSVTSQRGTTTVCSVRSKNHVSGGIPCTSLLKNHQFKRNYHCDFVHGSTYTVLHIICTSCPTDDAKGDKKVLTQFPPFSHKNVRGILQFYRKPTVMSIALRKASSTTLFNLVWEIFHNVEPL